MMGIKLTVDNKVSKDLLGMTYEKYDFKNDTII
jgi:hypothetical protein